MDDLIRRYIVDLANATRNHPEVYVGASPRASLSLMRAAQGLALLRGRDFVSLTMSRRWRSRILAPRDRAALGEGQGRHRHLHRRRDHDQCPGARESRPV